MSSPIVKIVLGAVVAATLGACASLSQAGTPTRADRFAQIHSGLTQQDVRTIAGTPRQVRTNPRTGEILWTYDYIDTWGSPSEFGVDFDAATGTVVETSRLRTDEH
jgi:hypothetical protein